MTDLPIRAVTAADWPALAELFQLVFHGPPLEPEITELKRHGYEPGRGLVVTDPTHPGGIVGHAAAYTWEVAVPGSVVPAAHVTGVVVAPTHRRRGLLRRLMHQQLASVPEPLAMLWASEPEIYPRFGYGLASARLELSVQSRQVRVPTPLGPSSVGLVPAAEVAALLPAVYEAVWRDRNGWSSRNEARWALLLADPPSGRQGATALRVVAHHGAGGVDGYAVWRAKAGRPGEAPSGELTVRELVAANPTAYQALWRFLLSVDLVGTVVYRHGRVDEPLLALVDNPRRLGPATVRDALYVRIVDLPAALAARRYSIDVDVVIEVTDPLLPANAGRWRLVGGPDRASCVRVDDEAVSADLACDIATLSAAYLAGVSLATLAEAGRVRELRPGTLVPASIGFGWRRSPGPIEIF